MPVSTECAAALLSFRYPSVYNINTNNWMSSSCKEQKVMQKSSLYESLPKMQFKE